MADETRMITSGAQPYVVGDKTFRGIDTFNDANKLEGGLCQKINNMQLDGGSLVLRNGIQGLLQPSECNTAPITVTFLGGGSPNINGTFPFILPVGAPIKFATDGALPTGINTTFTYVVAASPAPTASTIGVASVVGGPAINFSTTGTGPHYVIPSASYANGVFEMVPLKQSSGVSSNFVYTSAGEIRVFNTTTNSYTTLSTAAAFDTLYSPNVRMVAYGKYVYGVPGLKSDGTESNIGLFRTDGSTIEVVPSISGFPNLKPSVRPYPNVQVGVPATNKHLFIDSAVGPILRTGGDVTLISDKGFTAGATGALPTTGAAWLKSTGDPQRKDIPLTVSSGNFPAGAASQIVSPRGISSTRMIELAGTEDGFFQNIPYTGITYPNEQLNLIDQTNSSTAFTCTVASTTVTRNNHGLKVGQKLIFTGATGITANTVAWVLSTTTNTFTVSILEQGGTTYTFSASGSQSYFTIQGPGMFLLTFWAINVDTQNSTTGQSIKVSIQGGKNNVAIAGAYVSSIVAPPIARGGEDWIKVNVLVDFRVYRDQLTDFQVFFVNINAKDGSQKGIYVTEVNLHAVSPRLNTLSTDATDTASGLVKVKATQNNANVPGYAGLLAKCAIKFSFATAKDWSTYDSVSMRMQLPAIVRDASPRFRVGLQQANGFVEWGGIGTLDEQNGYMTWSLRGFTDNRINAVLQMYIRVEDDVKNMFSGDDFMLIGDIVVNGNLTAGIKYTYRFSRWYPEDGASAPFIPGTGTGASTVYVKGFESELSGISNEVTTTEALSSNSILLNPAAETLTGTGYTHLIIYRQSSSFTDGKYRCLGSIRLSDNTVYGVDLSFLSAVGGITLVDNVAEAKVFDDGPKGSQGDVYEYGQDNFPVGATAIAIHQQRLWVAKKNTLSVSWLFDADNEYTINTTNVPDFTDPKVSIKGASFDISSTSDVEYIVNMLSYHGDMMSKNNSTTAVLLVFRENVVYPVTGFDASSWSVQAFLREPGIGLLAPRALANVMGQPWYLNTNGIVQFAGTQVLQKSLQLDKMLSASPTRILDQTYPISASVYSRSFMAMHDKRLFVFAPNATSNDNSTRIQTGYVWDAKYNGWVTFTYSYDFDFTDAVSIASENDRNVFYIGNTIGQIFKMDNFYDSFFIYKPTSVTSNAFNFSGTNNTSNLNVGEIIRIVSAGNSIGIGSSYYVKQVTPTTLTLGWTPLTSATVTFSIGSADITKTSGLFTPTVVIGDRISFTTTGALPTGFTVGTTYFVVSITTNLTNQSVIQVSLTSGGPAITATGTQSGVHTISPATVGLTAGPPMATFREYLPISFEVVTRAYGQNYSEGIAYYSKNRPSQIDLFVEGEPLTGTLISYYVSDASLVNFSGGTYTFKGKSSRAIRGLRRDIIDVNLSMNIQGSEVDYAFRIYGMHLHMIESGITRHR
jgi:hypothetical protein